MAEIATCYRELMPYRSVILSFLLAVAAAVSALAVPLTLTVTGTPFSGTEGTVLTNQVVANVVDSDATTTAANFTGTINWGDGVTDSGASVTFTGAAGTFTVSGTHTYADEGPFTVSINVTDTKNSVSNSGTASATIGEGDVLNGTIVAIAPVEGAVFSGTVANFTDTFTNNVASDFLATVDWGDGVTSSATITGGSGAFAVSGSHTYQEESSYLLKVTLTDDSPGTATKTVSTTINVADAALSGSAVAIAPTAGTPFTGTVANFTDADPNGAIADYTATINWGDGTTTPGAIGSGFTVSGTHTYAAGYGGTFTLSVTVNDAGGATLTRSAQITVAPSPLFVPALSPMLLALLAIGLVVVALKRMH